ncbi:MAG: Asp-tRNA(Asn)/Glu-tRNA(Gln) amidotransferase subunit GatA [bacterium]|nr:Asp-tRNA(Asn)/Glu-tRNA(Gln) amidotransferase subunit GatA [bacterium]
MSLHRAGLKEVVSLLKKGEVSPVDVVRDLVDAVDERDGDVRAYLHFDKDAILEAAKSVAESAGYRSTLLAGAPIAVKDNICVTGSPTTCASRILENYHSPYTATAVERLIQAGGVVAGKTNLDEFAMGSSTEHSAYHPTSNPWDLERTPGGSSGGSAAAVASDLALAALGSDTGGSIRQPASLCGVVGMKPTWGRVSRYGLVAFASSLDQIGPITKNVEDCALMLDVICGHDPHDATSLTTPVPDLSTDLEKGCENLTIGVPRDFLEVGMDDEVRSNFDTLVDDLKSEGIKVVDVAMPNARYAVACYYIIANAEASSNLARYDGVKYGHRAKEFNGPREMYTRTRDEGFGPEVKRRILLGTYVLSAGYYDAYYLKAQKVRSLIIDDFRKAFEACDLVAMPTAPSPAFRFGEKADPLLMYASDVFTIPVNLAGLPGVSLPSGLADSRLPIGVQLVGRPMAESVVLQGARGVERIVDFKEKAFA